MIEPLEFRSLFAGIGGIDLGLETAGFRCSSVAEIDPFCREILALRFPNADLLGDVVELDAPTERMLTGGFPCQPVSDAGRKAGRADARWLWPAFLEQIRLGQPEVVLVENVRGLLAPYRDPEDATRKLAAPVADVLRDLASLGYSAEWDLIPAAAVGAPHLRFRVFIVAWRDGLVRNLFGPSARSSLSETWAAEPDVPRLLKTVPRRREKLTALGNAVVPQVVAWIGRRIRESEPDDLLWGWPVAELLGDHWIHAGALEDRPFLDRWPKAGYVVGGVAHGAATTIDPGMRARWKTPTSAPWSGGGCGGPLQMDVAAAERERWPTPDAGVFNDGQSVEAWAARRERELAKGYNGNGGGTTLAMAARLAEERFPTPTATDYKTVTTRGQRKGQLEERVRDNDELWPTPKASPSGPDYARADREGSGSDDLATAAARRMVESTGGLNPAWVEWLMGFPPRWTETAGS